MSTFTVRASWPSMVCAVEGLHAWQTGLVALLCVHCGEFLLYEHCQDYQTWEVYQRVVMANPEARLN